MDYDNDFDAFDKICGDCTGIDMLTITEDDIRGQAADYHDITEDDIQAAIRGLNEYRRTI